jgi:hypothetical protein
MAATWKLGRTPRRIPRINATRADRAVTAILEDDYSDALAFKDMEWQIGGG